MKNTKKKLLSTCLMAMTMFAASFMPANMASAEEAAAGQEAAAQTGETSEKPEVYLFASTNYGYTMLCPHRPLGVVPASMLYDGHKGDVIVFDNEEYNIKHAWVVLVDGFDDKAVPDLNKISDDDAKTYLEKLMKSSAYEGISLVNISTSNKGIFGISAKEVEVDTDGDGQFDTTATAETQEAVTFFRSESGRCIAIHLIDNPVLRPEAITAYQFGVTSFREIDTKNAKNTKDSTDKKDNKDKKDKKDKKDNKKK